MVSTGGKDLGNNFMSKFEQFIKRQSMQSILALGATIFVLTYFIVISVAKIPEKNQPYVNYTMGFLSGILTTVYSYYFGSTKNKPAEENKEEINP